MKNIHTLRTANESKRDKIELINKGLLNDCTYGIDQLILKATTKRSIKLNTDNHYIIG